MSLVQDTISGFIGGISQQPDKLMFPNQAKTLVNMNPSVITGLSRRKPTEHIKRLMNVLTVYPKTHTIVKEDEKYVVYLTGDGIRIFDLEGNEKEVYYNSKENETEETKARLLKYITSEQPLKDFDMVTIGDYTFVLNKTITTELLDENYPNPYPQAALIFVKTGDYGIDYNVVINGEEVATKTTSESSKADCKTTGIAQVLYEAICKKLTDEEEWRISKLNSCILIENLKGNDFTISTSDGNSDRNLFCFKNETENYTDLPTVAPDGYILKIVGENGDTSDDYYIQFTTTDETTFGTGTWKECCSPDLKYKVNPETMPHALVREADGSFTFKELNWTDRTAGDEDTAKTPSVFGRRISEVFSHKGRLGFLAEDKSLYSDVDDIFAYFKKTVMTKLDTDPIDVGSNSKMVLLKHSLPFNDDLLLFSPSSIFTVSGGDVFSNSTVTIDLTMEYPCSSLCKPISVGGTGLFVYENGDYSGVYEIYTSSTYTTAARCVTEQIPYYLPKGIFKLTGSTQNNIACLLSYLDSQTIYVHNFYYTSETKAQSAWHKWTFDGTVLNAEFVENYLYLTIQYEDGVYLERINIINEKETYNLDFVIHLDRRIALTEGSYDTVTKQTSFALPYSITNQNKLFVIDDKGFIVNNIVIQDNQLYIDGELSKVVIGFTYQSLWEMSNIYVREATSSGGSRVTEGVLMLGDINLTYLDSCEFRVITTPPYTSQTPSEYKFTGIITGTVAATLGKITPHSGTFLIPIMANNEDIKVEVISDGYLPCNFVSLVWIGEFNIRGK